MTDRILIERIAVYAHHGVHLEEERLGQRFLISLDGRLDLGPAGRADDLTLTVSYADLAALVVSVVTGTRFKLVEALAERIARDILADFPAITSVVVRIEKPSAPVAVVLERLAVEIERHRHG